MLEAGFSCRHCTRMAGQNAPVFVDDDGIDEAERSDIPRELLDLSL